MVAAVNTDSWIAGGLRCLSFRLDYRVCSFYHEAVLCV